MIDDDQFFKPCMTCRVIVLALIVGGIFAAVWWARSI